MAVTEAAKHDLYTHLQQTMGKERADTLMAMVSPTGWADVATKQDIEHLRTHDLALLRTELKGEMAELRTELKGEMAGLRIEMAGEFKNVRTEMDQFVTKAYLEKALRTQLYAIYLFNGIFMSLAVGLAQAIGG